MQASALGREAPRAGPAHIYLSLSEDPDNPVETRPSAARTAILALAATALISAPALFWASTADASNPPVATTISKQGAPGGDGTADDGPTGDDPDGTTAPGMTTTTDGRQGGTSAPGTSAPGVTTAPGETSEGGQQTTGGCPPDAANGGNHTTAGQDTSTAPGQETSNGGHGTNTTAGETASATDHEETGTAVGEQCPPPPLQPPEITPPEQQPPEQQPPEQQPPAQQPPAQQPPAVTPPQGQPQAQPPPAPPPSVLPARSVSPSARLVSPAGCPPQVFYARVTGRAISRVSFTIDGRRVKTLNRPDSNGVWKLRVVTRRYSVGRHRLVARVTFTGATARSISLRQAGERTVKALTVTFARCARKAQRPKFAG
jgi:hypothetical protein